MSLETGPLASIRVVLVSPMEPGNVGAAARAVANTGLGSLVVVHDRVTGFADDGRARAMSAGGVHVLESALVVPTLARAVDDCVLVVGFTSRHRVRKEPALRPLRRAARQILARAGQGPVALVFGPEDSGLANVDLDRCSMLVSIPASDAYPVYNLAAAVVVTGYELLSVSTASSGPVPAPDRLATSEELERLHESCRRVLTAVRFLGRRERQGMITLRGILARTGLQVREYRFLMGAVGRIAEAVGVDLEGEASPAVLS
ncbi:MAG: RNA methyltransferase [Candidatus Riflebacteria bacterium]|nr:RNA methyltransferase [Candidatus Riflebacteria bacterium]